MHGYSFRCSFRPPPCNNPKLPLGPDKARTPLYQHLLESARDLSDEETLLFILVMFRGVSAKVNSEGSSLVLDWGMLPPNNERGKGNGVN